MHSCSLKAFYVDHAENQRNEILSRFTENYDLSENIISQKSIRYSVSPSLVTTSKSRTAGKPFHHFAASFVVFFNKPLDIR